MKFLSSRTVVDLDQSRVIAFTVDEASADDRTFEVKPGEEGVLEILRPGEVLGGQTIGYFRVRGLQQGSTSIAVGGAQLTVAVVDRGGKKDLPRIVAPIGASAIWDEMGVGVEVFDRPGREPATVALKLSTGGELAATSQSPAEMGPHRRVYFELDASALPEGNLVLTPVARWPDGEVRVGEALGVRVVRPHDLIKGEGEGEYDVERPERFGRGNQHVAVGRDPLASGGAYRNNAGAYPPLSFPLHVERAGRYQVVLRVGGDMAGGALPTVALFIDNEDYPRASARLASERWHRLALGGPIALDAGEHVLTAFFVNDFYVPNLADRNLRIDTIEVARLDDDAMSLATLGFAKTGDAMTDAQRGAMGMSMMASAMSGGGGGGDALAGDVMGLRGSALRVAFDRVLDGLPIAGEIEIKGLVYAVGALEAMDPLRVPVVSLLINGEAIGHQRTLAPRFWIDASRFVAGDNTLQLVAELEGGGRAQSPVQRMRYEIEPTAIDRRPRRMYRFGLRDGGWDEGSRSRLTKRGWGTEQVAFAFMSPGTGVLELPEKIAGRYEVFLVAKGESFQGPPTARIELDQDGEQSLVGDADIPDGWRTVLVAEIELADGPKSLRVSFINDLYEKDAGDRNLLVQGIILREVIEHEDRSAPLADIVHPHAGDIVFMHDALVAKIRDDVGVERAELLVDGVAIGASSGRTGQDGLLVIPIAARGWAPGERRLTVRVTDAAGNMGESAPVFVRVSEQVPEQPTRYERAVHVLNRFAFGTDARQLARILEIGERPWLIEQLDTAGDDPVELAALGPALIRFPGVRNAYETSRRGIHHAMRTQRPARVRLVQWLDNHFSTWARKIQGDRAWDEYIMLQRRGATSFASLLMGSAQSPAMLAYLDQDGSFVGRINENYAREIMELHTLGVDRGYTQQDVTSLARVLTGWTSSLEGDPGAGGIAREYSFRFDPTLNDGGEAVVVGARLEAVPRDERYDRVLRVIETLAAHPSTARHISTELVEQYVGVPADGELVDDLTLVFHETGGDLREMLLAILDHDVFWASMETPRMRQPLDYALRLVRISEEDDNPWQVGDFLQRSGTQVFDRPTPDGYPEEDEAYADSNAMIQRWTLANDLQWVLVSGVPGEVRWANPDRTPGWDQLVVDYLAIAISGRVLGERSNGVALEYLSGLEGNGGERALALAPFVAQLPEANLR